MKVGGGGGAEAALEFVGEGFGEDFGGEGGEAGVLSVAGPEEAAHAAFGGDGFGEVATGEGGEEAEGAIDVCFADAIGTAKDSDTTEAQTEVAQGAVTGEADGVEHGGQRSGGGWFFKGRGIRLSRWDRDPSRRHLERGWMKIPCCA